MEKFVSRVILTATLLSAGYWCVQFLSQHSEMSMAAGSGIITAAANPLERSLKMTESNKDERRFLKSLPVGFQMPGDDAGMLLLREYGSVFVAREGVVPPTKVVFLDEEDVKAFQRSTEAATERIGVYNITLQRSAMNALKAAIAEARRSQLSITPRGSDSGSRGYGHTVSLWASRVQPGLSHWVRKGRITKSEANRITSLAPYQQVPEILRLEQRGIFFAKDLSKSIIYSVAPPGTSQHLSMLAFDVAEFSDVRVRAILAKYGWYQTVTSDLPHFTFLGPPETELPLRGLKVVTNGGRGYWVPDLPPIKLIFADKE